MHYNLVIVIVAVNMAAITGIHGNKNRTTPPQLQIDPFEHEPFFLIPHGLLNRVYLLCYHGQYFNINAIKFIKACPSARTRQTYFFLGGGGKKESAIVALMINLQKNKKIV